MRGSPSFQCQTPSVAWKLIRDASWLLQWRQLLAEARTSAPAPGPAGTEREKVSRARLEQERGASIPCLPSGQRGPRVRSRLLHPATRLRPAALPSCCPRLLLQLGDLLLQALGPLFQALPLLTHVEAPGLQLLAALGMDAVDPELHNAHCNSERQQQHHREDDLDADDPEPPAAHQPGKEQAAGPERP